MFTYRNARRGAWVTACVLAVGLVSPAVAKKAQRTASVASFSAADLIPIPKFSSTSGVVPPAALPQARARFFTISGALAKREAGRSLGAPVRLATSTPADRLSDIVEPTPAAIVRGDEPFGMAAFRAPEGLLWVKWRALASELKTEEAHLESCATDAESCSTEAARFRTMVGKVKASHGQAQFEEANRLINTAISYASDLSLHGRPDKWSPPLATLKLGKGDCEDYAILKYRLLTEAGVSTKDLRIVLVRDTAVRIDHAVLAARTGDRWFILDNRRSGFYLERDLPHYMPLFALNQDGVKLFAAPFASLPGAIADDAVLPGLDDEPAPPALADTLPLVL